MPVLSGKRGTLFLDAIEISPTSNWTISIAGNLKAYAANDTVGWKKRVAGVFDSTGTFEVKISNEVGQDACPVEKGGTYTALFYIDAVAAIPTGWYEVPIMVATIDVDDDIDDGEIAAFAITWEGNGPMEEHGILEFGAGGSSSGV